MSFLNIQKNVCSKHFSSRTVMASHARCRGNIVGDLLDNKVETFLSITFTEDGGLLAKIGGVPLRRQNH